MKARRVTGKPPPGQGWRQVSFAGDCGCEDGELGSACSLCGEDYAECECPGPTMDDYEYREFGGVLYARPIATP